ncbi:MAG: ATP-binding protein [Candidatus Neomarinimicrobiota bacterium]
MNIKSASTELYKNLYYSMDESAAIFKMIHNDSENEAVDFIVEDINPAIEKYFNTSLENIYGKSLRKLLNLKTIPFAELCKKALETGLAHTFEDQSLDPKKYLKISIIPGEENTFAIKIRDITQFKQHEEELRLSEDKYRLIVENANDGIVISQNDEFIYCNARFAEMLAYEPEELKNISFKKIYTEDGIHDLLTRGQKRMTGQALPNYYQTTFKKKDKSILEVDVNYQIINYRNMPATFAIIRDITEQKQAEKDIIIALEKAKESDQLKSVFLANMSHEIRTPMNGIMGFTQLLRKKDLSWEKHKEYLNIIERSSKRMLNLINDLIDISKIEAGQVKIYNSPFSVNKVLNYLEKFFLPECQEKNLKLNKICEKNTFLFGDKDKLEAVLTNLIKNAIKFTKTGHITFGCQQQSKFLQFFVEDTGIGIAKEKYKNIFSRFVQADNKISKPYEGAGLGLSICKAYVELMGGELKLNSELGKGSRFYFDLPLTQGGQLDHNAHTTPSSQSKNLHHLNIMIVEDDEPSLLFLDIIMRNFSQNIIHAKNGEEAVKLCKENKDLDLILMDLKMPLMDGFEATKIIREFNKNIIIIAQTAYAFDDDHEKIIQSGFDGHITKPIQENELKTLLAQLFS